MKIYENIKTIRLVIAYVNSKEYYRVYLNTHLEEEYEDFNDALSFVNRVKSTNPNADVII